MVGPRLLFLSFHAPLLKEHEHPDHFKREVDRYGRIPPTHLPVGFISISEFGGHSALIPCCAAEGAPAPSAASSGRAFAMNKRNQEFLRVLYCTLAAKALNAWLVVTPAPLLALQV